MQQCLCVVVGETIQRGRGEGSLEEEGVYLLQTKHKDEGKGETNGRDEWVYHSDPEKEEISAERVEEKVEETEVTGNGGEEETPVLAYQAGWFNVKRNQVNGWKEKALNGTNAEKNGLLIH